MRSRQRRKKEAECLWMVGLAAVQVGGEQEEEALLLLLLER